jgi:hypothetical protein
MPKSLEGSFFILHSLARYIRYSVVCFYVQIDVLPITRRALSTWIPAMTNTLRKLP